MDKEKEHGKENTIDFEIQFYEGVLKEQPDFIEALMAVGDLYTKKGLIKKGLEVDLRLKKLKPGDPIVLYNLSCSYSLKGDIDLALSTIKQAVDCGYKDFKYLLDDTDLVNLHQDQRFQEYLDNLKIASDDKED